MLAVAAAGLSATAGCASGGDDEEERFPDYEAEFDLPDAVALDESFSAAIDGLPANEDVDVRIETEDAEGTTWAGSATYRSSEDGRIDTDDEPRGGDVPDAYYERGGSPTMGLVQFATADIGRPYRAGDAEAVTIRAEIDGEPLGSAALTRRAGHPDAERIELPTDELAGECWVPPGQQRAPGVVLFHGRNYEPLDREARLLASRGYAALALHVFGDAWPIPPEPIEIQLEYVERAIDWLGERERVSDGPVGAYGWDLGGDLALLAGSYFDGIGAAVSVNGSGLVWEGVDGHSAAEAPMWTYGGEAVPYVEWYQDLDTWSESGRAGYEASLSAADESTVEAATIPVEEIDGPVLLVTGADTVGTNADVTHGIAAERRAAHGAEYEHLVYDDAGHSIAPPYRPVVGSERTGGTDVGAALADADYWPRVLETLSTLEDD